MNGQRFHESVFDRLDANSNHQETDHVQRSGTPAVKPEEGCPLSSLSGAGSHGSSRPDGTSLDDLRGRRRADSDTTEILESYLACKTKAYLRLHGKLGTKSDYEALSTETRAELRNRAAQMPVSRLKPEEVIRGVKITETALGKGAALFLDVTIEFGDLLLSNASRSHRLQ